MADSKKSAPAQAPAQSKASAPAAAATVSSPPAPTAASIVAAGAAAATAAAASSSPAAAASTPAATPAPAAATTAAATTTAEDPLETSWTFYFDKKLSRESLAAQSAAGFTNYTQNLQKVGTFTSVQQFWRHYSYMQQPDSIPKDHNLYMFRGLTTPAWESFPQGGCWIIKVRKHNGVINRLWEELCFAAVGEWFGDSDVVGITLSTRAKDDNIAVWNRGPDMNASIGEKLKEILNLDESTLLSYQTFKAAASTGSSFRGAKEYTFAPRPVWATSADSLAQKMGALKIEDKTVPAGMMQEGAGGAAGSSAAMDLSNVAQVDPNSLEALWSRGPANYAAFIEAVAGGPSTLQHVDLAPFVRPDLVASTPNLTPAVYAWQINVKDKPAFLAWLAERIIALTEEVAAAQAAVPPAPASSSSAAAVDALDDEEEEEEEDEAAAAGAGAGSAQEAALAAQEAAVKKAQKAYKAALTKVHTARGALLAFQRLSASVASHAGPHHPYVGLSTEMPTRYSPDKATHGHGATVLHLACRALAVARPSVVSVTFGVLAVGPPEEIPDDAMRTALEMERRLGALLQLDAAALSTGLGHVINAQMTGRGFGRFAAILANRATLEKMAHRWYETSISHEDLAKELTKMVNDGRPVKAAGARNFVQKHLKPIAASAGVKPSLLTRAAANVRAHGHVLDQEAVESYCELLQDHGWRLGGGSGSAKRTGHVPLAQHVEDVLSEHLDADARARFISFVEVSISSENYAKASQWHKELRARLVERQDKIDAARSFYNPKSDHEVFDPDTDRKFISSADGVRMFKCMHPGCDVFQYATASNVKKHWERAHGDNA